LPILGGFAIRVGVIEFVFPGRLRHRAPLWVPSGAVFHIRIRALSATLVQPEVASALLESAQFYQDRERWFIWLFLLMPDHLHALLSFPREERMSSVIGDWKRY
jgi:putative transposase